MSMLSIYVPSTWVLLAEHDQSADWEVDVSEVYIDEAGRFVLAQASGCSCWDGEYESEAFDTLDQLAVAVSVLGDARSWHLSPDGGAALVARARAALPEALRQLALSL